MSVTLDAALVLLDAASNGEIDRIIASLADSDYRYLSECAEQEYGSDLRDLADEPDMDKASWVEFVARAAREQRAFRQDRKMFRDE